MKKLAVIRGKNLNSCPYGLPITQACNDIGDLILDMQPLSSVDENEEKMLIKNNKITYLTQKTGERCVFANDIMNKHNVVECSHGDDTAGEGASSYLPASPFYPRSFIGDGVTMGPDNYQQNITDPGLTYNGPEKGLNVPFGMYSIFSNRSNEDRLIKMADKYTNKIVNIRDKLVILRDKYFDTLKLVISSNNIVKLDDSQLEELLFVIDDLLK